MEAPRAVVGRAHELRPGPAVWMRGLFGAGRYSCPKGPAYKAGVLIVIGFLYSES